MTLDALLLSLHSRKMVVFPLDIMWPSFHPHLPDFQYMYWVESRRRGAEAMVAMVTTSTHQSAAARPRAGGFSKLSVVPSCQHLLSFWRRPCGRAGRIDNVNSKRLNGVGVEVVYRMRGL